MATKAPNPAKLAKKADEYFLARKGRLAKQKEVDKLQAKETELKNYLIDNLPKSLVGGVQGKVARVGIDKKDVPKLDDRDKFFAYARRTKQLDLIVEQMNVKAVQDRLDRKVNMPGVSVFTVVKLTLHQVKPTTKNRKSK